MNSATEPFAHRRVFVTGGNGFVGANLIRSLSDRGAQVHLLVRPQANLWRLRGLAGDLRVHYGDMTDERDLAAAFQAAAPELVFHLATPRGSDASAWARLVETNVLAAIGLVKQMQSALSIRMVVAGSSLEYGPSSNPHREEDPLRPVTWHGVGKAAAGQIFLQASRAMGMCITQLRLFHVYGPWEAAHRMLPTLIRAVSSGAPISLTAAEARRDWVYVADVVDALLAAALLGGGGIYNIGSGREATNEEVVELVERLTGRSITIGGDVFPSSASDSRHRCADIGKARAELAWQPQHDLSAGVAASLAWHRANPSHWEDGFGDRPCHV